MTVQRLDNMVRQTCGHELRPAGNRREESLIPRIISQAINTAEGSEASDSKGESIAG